MTSSTRRNNGFRDRLRQKIDRLRDRSRGSLSESRIDLFRDSEDETSLATITDSSSQHAKSTSSVSRLIQGNDAVIGSTHVTDDESQVQSNNIGQGLSNDDLPSNHDVDRASAPSDLWSVAYREAVESLGEEIDVAILKGQSVAELFIKLEEIDQNVTQKDIFVRGIGYLHSIQGPLETFKTTLDLASPVANIDPTATTIVGIVKSVTEIIIKFAKVDVDFAKQISEMQEKISYIDDCDTLGQKANKEDIHKALVLVYKKLLEFYKVAFETLTKKGAKLIIKMVLENDRLPRIVQDFLQYSEALHKLIINATLEIVEEMRTMLYHDKIVGWLGGNKLLAQDKYHDNLEKLRANEACEFLLENTHFQDWFYAPGPQQLAISGPMGCGKTVIMTFLVDELKQRSKYQLPTPKVCRYYCRDDETGQMNYILSALILSLLNQLPGLKRPFYEWYDQALISGTDPAASTSKMEELMQKLLKSVDRPIFIFVDGLDECNDQSQHSLLKFLKSSSQMTPGLKVILSFRPQEEILDRLDGMPRIDLCFDSHRDRIIVEKTVETQLNNLPADVKAVVIERLSDSAQGSAIWTKMIVELIKVKRIKALDPMERFLKKESLPQNLSETYLKLISRCTSNDLENQELVWVALKLLATARRPLSILELAWAVALNAAPHISSVVALSQYVDHQRLMSLIDSFIVQVDFNDVKKRQVQLVHQSVKEFIKEHTFRHGGDLIVFHQTTMNQRNVEDLDAFMLDTCVKYLLLEEIGNRDLFSMEQVAIAELPQESDLFNDADDTVEYDPYCTWEAWEEKMIRYDPSDRGFGEFFVYASCHWLEHFGAITTEHLPSLVDIENLCKVGSTRLSNWIEQNRRPDCAINPRFEFDSDLYDPLSVTSLYASEAMLRHMLENSDLSTNMFFRNSAIRATDQVLQWGDVSRLRILFLDDRVGYQLQTLEFFRLVIKYWSNPKTPHDNWDTIFDLFDNVSSELVQQQGVNELLEIAVGAKCKPMIQRLMTVVKHS